MVNYEDPNDFLLGQILHFLGGCILLLCKFGSRLKISKLIYNLLNFIAVTYYHSTQFLIHF